MEMSNVPNKELKFMVIKMLTELGRRMDEHNGNFNKEMENIRKYQTEVAELKNSIMELGNTLQGFKRRLHEEEERVSECEAQAVELIQSEQQKEKRKIKSENSLKDLMGPKESWSSYTYIRKDRV